MSFHISISGTIDHLKSELHDEIVKLAKYVSDELKALGIEHSGSVGTPTAGTTLSHTVPPVVVTAPSATVATASTPQTNATGTASPAKS